MLLRTLTTESEVYQAAIDYLSRREHASQELKSKLKAKGADDNLIDVVLTRVQTLGYQSDERYIEMIIRSRKARGYGPNYIRQMLQQFRLDSSLIDAYIDSRNPEWNRCAYQQLSKKFKQPETEFKLRQKQQQHLYQRGFSSEQIRSALSLFDQAFE